MSALQSLFLAHVSDSVDMSFVSKTFQTREIGVVERIEWIPNVTKEGTPFKTCFVYFSSFYETPASLELRHAVAEMRQVKFVYSEGRRAAYWKVAANTSSIADYPPNKHVDLEVLVDAHVMSESVEDMLEQLDLGKVLKVSRERKGGAQNPHEEFLGMSREDPRNMLLPVQHENERVRIQFEYWHRNLAAAQFQYRLFDARSAEAGPPYVKVQVSDCMVLKIYAVPAKIAGSNPFVWVNPASPSLPRVAYAGSVRYGDYDTKNSGLDLCSWIACSAIGMNAPMS